MEEISLKEFEELSEERGTRGKVDYDAVLAEIEGRALTVKAISDIMLKHAHDKKKVYYSEVTNWLERLEGSENWEVTIKHGDRKFVLVRKKS